MTTCLGKSCSFGLPRVCIVNVMCFFFSFDFEGEVWDYIVLAPDRCLSFYLEKSLLRNSYSFIQISQRLVQLLNYAYKYINFVFLHVYRHVVELLEAFGNDAEGREFKLSFGHLILARYLGNFHESGKNNTAEQEMRCAFYMPCQKYSKPLQLPPSTPIPARIPTSRYPYGQ